MFDLHKFTLAGTELTRFCENYKKVIVAVSGGADSMSLLHLCQLSLPVESIIVAHVNHGLRGDDADKDEKFVCEYCFNNGLNFQVLHVDVKKLKQTGESEETCGRRIRYHFFGELAAGDGLILTAHTASDVIETLFMNVVRGTGSLKSIPKVRGNIFRPLLDFDREEIEDYCNRYNLKFVTDNTNLTDDYTRNKIRHQVVPTLREINPALSNSVTKLMKISQLENEYLDRKAAELIKKCKIDDNVYNAKILVSEDLVILSRALLKVAKLAGASAEYQHIQSLVNILKSGKGQIVLPNAVTAVLHRNELAFISNANSREQKSQTLEELLINGKARQLSDKEFLKEFSKIDFKTDKEAESFPNNTELVKIFLKKDLQNAIDCDKINFNIAKVRNCNINDRISLKGRGNCKLLTKWFSEAKIPKSRQSMLKVIEDDNGIFYVESLGVDERAALSNTTKRILFIL